MTWRRSSRTSTASSRTTWRRPDSPSATLLKNGVIKSGQQAMVVDDAEAYAANQADDTQKLLEAGGLKVDRESQPASTGTATANFSALANKAVAIHADVVFSPTQVASDAQLFAQQLKSAGYKGIFVSADGAFDPTNFKFPGAYLTYFGADVNKVPVAKPYLDTFTKLYGKTLGFGPPTFTALEMIAIAISNSCADGKTSRAEVLKAIKKVKISNSILGNPIAFDNDGRPLQRAEERRHASSRSSRTGATSRSPRPSPRTGASMCAARHPGGPHTFLRL